MAALFRILQYSMNFAQRPQKSLIAQPIDYSDLVFLLLKFWFWIWIQIIVIFFIYRTSFSKSHRTTISIPERQIKRWKLIDLSRIWQYGLWSFQMGDTKLEILLPKNQHPQRKLLNFENWISGGLRSFQKSDFSKSIIFLFSEKKYLKLK